MLEIECMHCLTLIGTKEGHGVTGVTSVICPCCLQKHYGDLIAKYSLSLT